LLNRFYKCLQKKGEVFFSALHVSRFIFGGILTISVVVRAESARPLQPLQVNPVIVGVGSKNLLPNSSFECGVDGWGSLGSPTGWGGALWGLYGQVQSCEAYVGQCCLRIEMGPAVTPVTYFDSPNLHREIQYAPLAANWGWLGVTVGKNYTLSAYLRANKPGVTARLQVIQPGSDGEYVWTTEKHIIVVLSSEWRRYFFSIMAEQRQMSVALGPDLTTAQDMSATVWIDAVQLEEGDSPTEFCPRQRVEVGLNTHRIGNVFEKGELQELSVNASNNNTQETMVELNAKLTDYFDRPVKVSPLHLKIPPESTIEAKWPLSLPGTGHYRANFSWQVDGQEQSRMMNLAVIKSYGEHDSPFGINHAPTTPEVCDLLRRGGVTWARDWSMRWDLIEPQPQQFYWRSSDEHVNRLQAARFNILSLLPVMPSSGWSSSAPEDVDKTHLVFSMPWARFIYAPGDPDCLEQFLNRVVSRYRNNIKVWEFLNEPLFTPYSLPDSKQNFPAANYTVADYIRLLKAAYDMAKQSDPNSLVIGGIGCNPFNDYAFEFIRQEGLRYADIGNLHIYPVLQMPEGYAPQMDLLLALMDKSRIGRKPIWITEHGYYATDNLPWAPFNPPPWSSAARGLLKNEKQCADWTVRFLVLMLAHNVEKIFLHQGAGDMVNRAFSNLEFNLLSEQAAPRKLYPALAFLADRLGPKPSYRTTMAFPPPIASQYQNAIYGYAFQCGSRAVLVAWLTESVRPPEKQISLAPAVNAFNVVGNPLSRIVLSQSPVYLESTTLTAENLAVSWFVTADQ
jgi:hypothetical protein